MAKITWVDETTAAHMIGLPVERLIRLATDKKLEVRIARATRKARPRFVKEDIETLLQQKIVA
jgi:hypothetical protein